MATNFPSNLDAFTNPTSGDTLDSPDHASQHADVNDAVEALQAKVGVDGSTDQSSLDWRVLAAAPVGTVMMSAAATTPDGWLLCDGSAVSRTTYADLFGALGTNFGVGDGSTTFNLPNMTGNVARGTSGTPTSGGTGGQSSVTLDATQVPLRSHGHTLSGTASSNATHSHTWTPTSHNHIWSSTFSFTSDRLHSAAFYTVYYTSGNAANFAIGRSSNTVYISSGTVNTGYSTGNGTIGNADANHSHSNPPETGTTSQTAGSSVDLLDPYLQLRYIIKT